MRFNPHKMRFNLFPVGISVNFAFSFRLVFTMVFYEKIFRSINKYLIQLTESNITQLYLILRRAELHGIFPEYMVVLRFTDFPTGSGS